MNYLSITAVQCGLKRFLPDGLVHCLHTKPPMRFSRVRYWNKLMAAGRGKDGERDK